MLSSPVEPLCPFLSVQSNEGKLETKTPISQAIRLLFCALYSSSESHANSYSFLFHLFIALQLLLYGFFSSLFWCCLWNHVWVIFTVMHFFPFKDTESIYNSLSVSAVHLLFIAPPSSFFFLPVSLSLHLFQPEAASFIHHRKIAWPVCIHTLIHHLYRRSFQFNIILLDRVEILKKRLNFSCQIIFFIMIMSFYIFLICLSLYLYLDPHDSFPPFIFPKSCKQDTHKSCDAKEKKKEITLSGKQTVTQQISHLHRGTEPHEPKVILPLNWHSKWLEITKRKIERK